MKQAWKKLGKNSMWLMLMLGLCGMGIRVALSSSHSSKAVPVVSHTKQEDIVFVLDAGHGESTETEL